MAKTKKVWYLDIMYIRGDMVQDRRYICTNRNTLDKYRRGISDKVLSYELRPGRVSRETVSNNVIKLVNPEDD